MFAKICKADFDLLMAKPVLTVREVATVLGIGANSAYARVKDKTIPSVSFGKTIRIPTAKLKQDLGEFLHSPPASVGVGPTAEPPKSGLSPAAVDLSDFKTAMMRINRAGWEELSILSIRLDRALEDLIIEAANDLLKKHGRPPVIEKRSPPRTKKRAPAKRRGPLPREHGLEDDQRDLAPTSDYPSYTTLISHAKRAP